MHRLTERWAELHKLLALAGSCCLAPLVALPLAHLIHMAKEARCLTNCTLVRAIILNDTLCQNLKISCVATARRKRF